MNVLKATYDDVGKIQRASSNKDLAALTSMASLLLNLDAALVR